eukprot:TRINITY_DN2558_c0_g2_i7.p1 TRINITY_DN2558_c0_g2~~TRINITY_DN2558_c0_g2_i7.p1  ORF type:complete len:187 (+),score=23.74 TRINITY_DN2558_c0_g2_i7:75-635(+)
MSSLIYLLLAIVSLVVSIQFELPPVGSKCIIYELIAEEVITGEYELVFADEAEEFNVDFHVHKVDTTTGSHQRGEMVTRTNKINKKGTFGFTPHSHGEHELCFEVFHLGFSRMVKTRARVELWTHQLPKKFVDENLYNKSSEVCLPNKSRDVTITLVPPLPRWRSMKHSCTNYRLKLVPSYNFSNC